MEEKEILTFLIEFSQKTIELLDLEFNVRFHV